MAFFGRSIQQEWPKKAVEAETHVSLREEETATAEEATTAE